MTLRIFDISAADTLRALTVEQDGGPGQLLWRNERAEVNCSAAVDNDLDGLTTKEAPDCVRRYYGHSGFFCLDRTSTKPSAINVLVSCNGSTLVSSASGSVCVQVGSGGSDYLCNIT